ncbi:MAG: prepilin-type N-terminal cleavage/methylation domain-containing protein [Lachnospiraceae bacterium]|jgi:prepilin-type N-terminal cleavage/methylation domain-containing protein|nr:prepilin-type N-terminal cleavage/methylation domain-containing protein [Lachnospiraceae bacterium]MDD3615024.1 prepilin-type N-terminal cleavage/methylation domain-containing protein [Lachnospiraceae bacterium]
MRQKINSQKGFTLSEMLMSVLVMLLATLIIAGGVTAVRSAYINITLKADAQTLLSTTISAMEDDLRYAQNINISNIEDGTTTVAFDSPSRGYNMYFLNDDSEGILIANTQSTATVPLVTDKAMANNLFSKFESEGAAIYNPEDNIFTLTIKVCNKKDSDKVLAEQQLSIKPINS